jgi:hypothetical protein
VNELLPRCTGSGQEQQKKIKPPSQNEGQV